MRLPRKGGRVYKVNLPFEKGITGEVPPEYRVLEVLIEKKGYVKNVDIRNALGISRLKAARLAKRLVDLGLLNMVGTRKGTRYVKPK